MNVLEKEKGVGFTPGGEIPYSIRTTVWAFMGQATLSNYGKLLFGLPLSTRDHFDPSSESIHGLLSGSSWQKKAPEEDDEPMNDPHTQPSRHSKRKLSTERGTSAGYICRKMVGGSWILSRKSRFKNRSSTRGSWT